jgi:formate dehydrogenase maturation protein FdhE
MTTWNKLVADAAKAYDFYSEDELEAYANEVNCCPKCGSRDISPLHHTGNFAIPETNYNHCNTCSHSWGFE